MRKLIATVLILFVAFPCFGEVKLHRYIDRDSGEERGISYSDKDGNPVIRNSAWTCEEISESQKEFYINKRNEQLNAKPKEKSDLEKRVEALEKKIN